MEVENTMYLYANLSGILKVFEMRNIFKCYLFILLQENISTPEPADISEDDHYSSEHTFHYCTPFDL
jgi:hypothetical protein